MTPGEIATYARQQYNSVSDSFFSDEEMYTHIWAAQMELALFAECIRRVYTTSTVASQQEYEYPTNTISIKRVTYDGLKLVPISFREDDALTLSNSTTTATGTPQYYAIWNEVLYLRPIPAGVGTLQIFSINEPQEVTNTSILEVPTRYHLAISDYLLSLKAAKDKNFQASDFYSKRWETTKMKARAHERKFLRGDGFTAVHDYETLPLTVIEAT